MFVDILEQTPIYFFNLDILFLFLNPGQINLFRNLTIPLFTILEQLIFGIIMQFLIWKYNHIKGRSKDWRTQNHAKITLF